MGIAFKCQYCGKKFNASSIDRRTTSSRSIYLATCPKCGNRAHKRVARSK